jgi:drug/metabolite transporter (DMT)-like permease
MTRRFWDVAATSLRNSSVFFAQVLALFLGEKVAKRQWVGATLIALGAALLAYYK